MCHACEGEQVSRAKRKDRERINQRNTVKYAYKCDISFFYKFFPYYSTLFHFLEVLYSKTDKILTLFGDFFIIFAKKVKTTKNNMRFENKIKELRIQLQMPQRKLAAALDIDTATYCKIEKGERRARREQVAILSQILNIDENSLLTLWLADKVTDMVASEHEVATSALSIAAETIKKSV